MYKHNDPCLAKAFPHEKLFVLMARDETAPEVILEWIRLNLRKQPIAKLTEALNCAIEMANTGNQFQTFLTRPQPPKSMLKTEPFCATTIRQKFGARFMEIDHQTCYNHVNFSVYIKPIKG